MVKSKDSFGIVFIHGAGLGSFIWDDIRPIINYRTLAIDFPNRRENEAENQELDFSDYLKYSIDQIERWNKHKMILVAHSIGGCLGLKLGDYFEEKILGFDGIGAAIPQNGKSFSSCLPFPQRNLLPIILNIVGTEPPPESIE